MHKIRLYLPKQSKLEYISSQEQGNRQSSLLSKHITNQQISIIVGWQKIKIMLKDDKNGAVSYTSLFLIFQLIINFVCYSREIWSEFTQVFSLRWITTSTLFFFTKGSRWRSEDPSVQWPTAAIRPGPWSFLYSKKGKMKRKTQSVSSLSGNIYIKC